MERARSLVLVTVDCLRGDHVGFLGYSRPTTPLLDSLAAESIIFSNAIAAGSPTYYSFPALMASRYPLAFGRDVVGLVPEEPTLATVLSESGYATGAFIAGNPYLSGRFGYDAGFEVFRDFLDADAKPSSGLQEDVNSISSNRWNLRLGNAFHKLKPMGSLYDELYFQYCQRLASPPRALDALRCFPSADVIVDHACNWIENLGQRPFFLWLHLMDPHAPYYPPQKALAQMGDDGMDTVEARYLNSYWNRGDLSAQRLARHRSSVIELYDAGIRWVDTQVARLVSTLRALGAWSNCLMALTADHGEEFLDHGGRFHPPNKLTEELLRVPLLLRVPEVGETKPIDAPFSLLHVAPTLLDALNMATPGSFCGRSFWKQLQTGEGWDGEAFAECVRGCTNPFVAKSRLGARLLAVRESRFKLVLDFGSASCSLFDLLHDPGERASLPASAEKQVRGRLLEKARRHISRSLNLRGADHVLAMRLRDLQLELAQPAIAKCA